MEEVKVKNLGFITLLLINIWIALLCILIQLASNNANAQVQATASIKENTCNTNLDVIRECCSGVKF